MGLRPKVALMLVAAIVPISLVFSIWRIGSEHRAHLERRAERAASRLQHAPMRRCEKRPQIWQLERREFVAFAYDSNFRSLNPNAPGVPPQIAQMVRASGDPVHHWFLPARDRYMGVTAVKIADSGPCAVVMFGWLTMSAPPRAFNRALEQTVGLAFVLGLLGLVVAFPIVRRIRRLEDAVRGARSGDFLAQIGGDDEINRLAEAFEETFAAVRQRERALEEYIANTTHDLAIPLTVLQHRLRKMCADDDSDDLRVALEESHYIASLIANMRTAAKLQTPDAMDYDYDVNWTEIVERVAQRHEPIASQNKIELNWSVPDFALSARGEPTLAEQALSNLVQNAVQYNAPGGHVSIVVEDVDGEFEVRVSDDGPGIPQSRRDVIFERGVRADDARTRNEEGQGFGLSIVRRVCDLHGWSLRLNHDEGLTVIIAGSRST